MNNTIYTISESPKDSSVVWAGTDDGNVQVTRDAGEELDECNGEHQGHQRRADRVLVRG